MQEWFVCKDCKQIIDLAPESLMKIILEGMSYFTYNHENCPAKVETPSE